MTDLRGGTLSAVADLFLAFVNEYTQIIKRSVIYNRVNRIDQLKAIARYRILSLLWTVCNDIHHEPDWAFEFLQYSIWFDNKVYTAKFYYRLEKFRTVLRSRQSHNVHDNAIKLLHLLTSKKSNRDRILEELKFSNHSGYWHANEHIPQIAISNEQGAKINKVQSSVKLSIINEVSEIVARFRPTWTSEQGRYMSEKKTIELATVLEISWGIEEYTSEDTVIDVLEMLEWMVEKKWYQAGIGHTRYDELFDKH